MNHSSIPFPARVLPPARTLLLSTVAMLPFAAIGFSLLGQPGSAAEWRALCVAALGGVAIATIALLLRKQKLRLRARVHSVQEHQGMLRAALDATLDGVMFLLVRRAQNRAIMDFELIDLNDKAAALLGKTRAELLAQRFFSPAQAAPQDDFFDRCVQVVETGQALAAEVELAPEGGAARWIYQQIVPIRNGVAVFAHDISAHKQAESDMRSKGNFLQSLVDSLPLLVHVKSLRADSFGQTVVWNKASEAFSGYSAERLIDDTGYSPFPEKVREHDAEEDRAMLAHPAVIERPERRVQRPDGSIRYLHSTSVPLFDAHGKVEYIVRIAADVTPRREVELALRASEARLRTIADTLPAMVAYIDGQVYRFYNLAYQRELDQAGGAQALGMTVRQVVGEQRYAVLGPYIVRALQGQTVAFEEHDDQGAGERTMAVTYMPQRGEDNQSVVGFHVMRQDITSQKRENKHLLKLAHVDSLTGLTNRAGFMKKLTAAMRASADDGDLMALMFMDIDHFKPVNDTYGHAAGDQLLKAFSARLTGALRAADTVARLGGDEFTIIMEKVGRRDDAAALADKIVAAMRVPFDLDGIRVSVSTSIGVAFYQHGALSPETLLEQADMLLYQAKQAGRDTFRCAA